MEFNCSFCEEYSKKIKESKSDIIYETKEFLVFPTVGCFTEGYCLIIPKKHCASFAELSNCQSPEIFPIKNKISPEVFPKRGQK